MRLDEKRLNGLSIIFSLITVAKKNSLIVDGILVLIIGVLSNMVKFEWSVVNISLWLALLLFAGFSIFIKYAQYAYENNLPVDLINELKSSERLEVAEKEITRQTQTKEYINTSLKNLNEATCNYLPTDFCQGDIREGLIILLNELNNNTTSILGVSCTRYYLGAYLKSILSNKIDGEENAIMIELQNNLFDDSILFDINAPALSGLQLNIATEIKKCMYNHRMEITHISDKFTMVSFPIPDACQSCDICEKIGGLFIIVDSLLILERLPNDLKSTLEIFGQITGNWIAKYNACIRDKFKFTRQQKSESSVGKVASKITGGRVEPVITGGIIEPVLEVNSEPQVI